MSGYVRHIKQPEKNIASRLECLDIELTERCNNDCIHCCINLPAGDAEAQAREMTICPGHGYSQPGCRPGLHAGALYRR